MNKEQTKVLSHLALIIGKCDDLESEIVGLNPLKTVNNSDLSLRLESLSNSLRRIRVIIDTQNKALSNMIEEISEKISEVTEPVQLELNEIFKC